MSDAISYSEYTKRRMFPHIVTFAKYQEIMMRWRIHPDYERLASYEISQILYGWCVDHFGESTNNQYPHDTCNWAVKQSQHGMDWSFKKLEDAVLFKFFVLSLLE